VGRRGGILRQEYNGISGRLRRRRRRRRSRSPCVAERPRKGSHARAPADHFKAPVIHFWPALTRGNVVWGLAGSLRGRSTRTKRTFFPLCRSFVSYLCGKVRNKRVGE